MANPLRGTCELTVNDTTYHLVFDQNAICELEGQLPDPFFVCSSRWARDDWQFREIRALLWCGMRNQHRGVTLEQCGEIMGILTPRGIIEAILPAFVRAIRNPDEPKAETVEGNAVADAGTGIAS